MANFVPPIKKIIPASEVMAHLEPAMGKGLEKDLYKTEQYTEEICQTCHGTGLVVQNNVYGLTGDTTRSRGLFPYKHQSLSFCQDCYNGVVRRCNYCGKLLNRGWLKCDCETQKAIEKAVEQEKERKALEDARLLSDAEASRMTMFYSEYYPDNEGFFEDWDDFFEAWEKNHKPEEERPEYVWATRENRMFIDAESIVESACDDLDEDAYDRVSAAIPALQDVIDEWLNKYGTSSFSVCREAKVRIPWERYQEEEA